MLAKLISLLLHAKSGAISGIFLLGATGALVTVSATTNNGTTTITLTEASPSPSASVHPSASPSPSASSSHSSSPSSSACTDEAAALAFQVHRVDSAFSGFHTDLMKLRGLRSKRDIQTADRTLKDIRQAAVKGIHGTATAACKEHDGDEDANDEDRDDEHDEQGDNPKSPEHASPTPTATPTPTPAPAAAARSVDDESRTDADKEGHGHKTGLTFSGDAKSIADQAIAAMQVAFDAAKNAPATTPKPHSSHTPGSQGATTTGKDHKGEHHD